MFNKGIVNGGIGLKHVFLGVALAAIICPAVSAQTAPDKAPEMITLLTGSEVATWTMPPEKPVHKTPVIFVHGGPGMYTTPGVFAKGAPLRAAGFTTVYFDQAGGGKSKRLAVKDYTVDRAVADLEAMRVSLKQDKIILWGSSWGASLATIYAVRYPDHVVGMILTSPGSYPGTHASHNYKITNRGKDDISKAVSAAASKIDKQGAAAETTLSQAEAGVLFDEVVNADLMGGLVCKGAKITPPTPGTGGNFYANRLIAKDLDKMKFKTGAPFAIPTLIVRGSCDFLSPDNADLFAKLFTTSVTTIAGTGHGLLENRTAIDAAFSDFAGGALAKVE